MKKLFAGIILATSFMTAGVSAHAASVTTNEALVFKGVTSDFGYTFDKKDSGKSFTSNFTFNSTSMFDLTASVVSIALKNVSNLHLSSFTLTGNGTTINGTSTISHNGTKVTFDLSGNGLKAGSYTLSVSGDILGTKGGSFGGNISIAAVPEASTTAMMLGGLALVGIAAVRRRRQDGAKQNQGTMALA